MKKKVLILFVVVITLCLTGCNNGRVEDLEDNLKGMELTSNLVTYTAYYHNVVEYDKKSGNGMLHWFEKDRKLFAEYTGVVDLGIDLSEVNINVKGNKVYVLIPKAKIIGNPGIDEIKPENFIESKEGINKNPITADDSAGALEKAQREMKKEAENDTVLLSLAQKRAKVVLEQLIKEFSNLNENQYDIIWEYE